MGIMDAFEREDRTEIKVTALYQMLREAAKCELLMNAVNCDVPHKFIREMATGEKGAKETEVFVPIRVLSEALEISMDAEDSEGDKTDVEEGQKDGGDGRTLVRCEFNDCTWHKDGICGKDEIWLDERVANREVGCPDADWEEDKGGDTE